MLVLTTPDIPGQKIDQVLGLVRGNTVQSRNMFSQFGAGIKSMIGGELHAYTRLMDQTRDHAIDRMVEHAKDMGADAIIMVRLDTGSSGPAIEMLAYGTAVTLKKS